MSLITRNNYEAYLLDYVEENLSPELIAELMLFLENNPDLKEELEEFENCQLLPFSINFTNKEDLKRKEITLDNYEEFIIMEIEGENTPEISKELHLFLKNNPEKQKEFDVYQKTKLVAPIIIFDDKQALKKKEGKVIPLYWWYSSAAAVILILFLLKGLNENEHQKENTIANKKNVTAPKENKNELLFHNEELVKQNKVVVVKKEKFKSKQKLKKAIKTHQTTSQHKEDLTPDLTDNQLTKVEEVEDSLPNNEIIDQPNKEEVLYANSVKITYENEPIVQQSKPMTRFEILKTIFNKRVKEKIIKQQKDENGEVVAYAVNIAGIEFTKNRKKN